MAPHISPACEHAASTGIEDAVVVLAFFAIGWLICGCLRKAVANSQTRAARPGPRPAWTAMCSSALPAQTLATPPLAIAVTNLVGGESSDTATKSTADDRSSAEMNIISLEADRRHNMRGVPATASDAQPFVYLADEEPQPPVAGGAMTDALAIAEALITVTVRSISARWQRDQRALTVAYFFVVFCFRLFLRSPYSHWLHWAVTMAIEDSLSLLSFASACLYLHLGQASFAHALFAKLACRHAIATSPERASHDRHREVDTALEHPQPREAPFILFAM